MFKNNLKKTIILFVAFATFLTSIPMAFASSELPFTDLSRRWNFSKGYYSVKNLYEKGIISGKTDTLFAPNDTLTREEAAKIIVLAAGASLSDAQGTFTDVEPGSWYEKYVNTAYIAGIMQGSGDGSFGIGTNITRQDAAVIVTNMAKYKSIALEKTEDYTIADLDSISGYALDAVTTLVNMNVADLKSNNNFEPASNITRLEFCIFIDRVLISDVNAYDDYIQGLIPAEKAISEYSNMVEVAFEDFEDDTFVFETSHAGIDTTPAERDTSVGKDSSGSLKHDNLGIENLFFSDIEVGVEYCFSWEIKTEDMENAKVRVNFEWYDEAKKNISGGYIIGGDITKNMDWTNQTYVTNSVAYKGLTPAFLRIAVQLVSADPNCTDPVCGKVWLDNLRIYKIVYDPLKTVLDKPAYKGLITDPDGRGDIRVTSYIDGLGSLFDEEDYKLIAEISPITDGKTSDVIRHSEISEISEKMNISFSSGELEIGDYDLAIRLVNINDNTELDVDHWTLRKRENGYKPKYYFDDYGRVVKDGELYFGIGAYARSFADLSVLTDFANKPIDFIIENSFSSHWENYENYEEFAKSGISVMLNTESVYKDAIRKQYQHGDISTIASERVVLETDDATADESAFKAGGLSNFASSEYYYYESYDIGEVGNTGCILVYADVKDDINFQNRAYMLEKVAQTLNNEGEEVTRLYLHGYAGSITKDLTSDFDEKKSFADLSESSNKTMSDLKKGDIVRFAENASGRVVMLERAFAVDKEPPMHIDDLTASDLHYEYGTLYNTNATHFEAVAKTDLSDVTEDEKMVFAYKYPAKIPVYNMIEGTITLYSGNFQNIPTYMSSAEKVTVFLHMGAYAFYSAAVYIWE